MRIRFEFHGTAEDERQLGHVEQRLVVVEPQVVVGNAHLVERDLLGVLEEAVGPPNAIQPVHVQDAVLLAHVFGQPEPRIPPALRQKYVRHIGHRFLFGASGGGWQWQCSGLLFIWTVVVVVVHYVF